MRRSRFVRLASRSLIVAALMIIAPAGMAIPAGEQDLHLEVIVNGTKTGLIGAFRRRADGRLAVRPRELRELGLKADPYASAGDGLIDLDRLPGLSYRLDQRSQTIRIDTGDAARLPLVFDLRRSIEEPGPAAAAAPGAVLNYLLYGSTDADVGRLLRLGPSYAAAASLDARIFGSFGVLSQTGIFGFRPGNDFGALRLDTTWTYSDPVSLVTYRGGDLISGALAWTRPVRIGGIQVQRNFSLRPDLVTMPLPGFSGSASVPSTVDVYVNNLRTFSRDLPGGPFEIRNLPIVSGPGTQRIVLRDALGRETVTDQAFYASPKLLRAGLSDFSVEAGFPRLDYGARSNRYASDPVASATLRTGFREALTLELHAEGSPAVLNGGGGFVAPLGTFGIASLAFAGSHMDGRNGAQLAASFEAGFAKLLVHGRTLRTFGHYADVASEAARPHFVATSEHLFSFRPPRAVDQISLSFPLGLDPARAAFAFTHLDDGDVRHRILSASISRSFGRDLAVFATAFADFGARGVYGIYGGLTRSFGQGISATASASTGSSGASAGIDVVKSQPIEIGSHGWRVREREGSIPNRAAAASYRAPFARMQAGVEQFGSTVRASGEVEGAIALAGGSVFFTNRIDDAFAVVDAGAANVDVLYENRPVGRTDASGKLLVPNLRSYQSNRIAIDPKALPVDAVIERTKESVAPSDRAAAIVRFGVNAAANSAIVTFRDARGSPISAGSRGVIEATGDKFVVGYDGEAFLHALGAENAALIELRDGTTCRARFPFAARPGIQVRIGAVPCT